ncbi:UDP-glucose 4-epimerase [Alkalibacterium sp. AK22]|uniref:NAD-dependent epimerase/dehydratase family protein n=1 Tax=Alkalibacterium sp. AK22 TaxID=1229520 RepID=UPI00045212BE|nr:NAD-dependent epimerase/dehydratase family protein [Alkalibacterium sp. AK22]EXJ23313.1 UDP-glucose 4-epimerase [Alkalibacterium sp. AK22]
MKKILITGMNSYIGTSVENWLMKEPENYDIDKIDMKDEAWRKKDFSIYDVVFHVAGIAHVSSDPKMEDLYYKVNRDLTIETAQKAKAEGVKQFIFMSSIIVYGDSSSNKRVIDEHTVPDPSNFYGDSKLQAEEGIKCLDSKEFRVAIVRPPMIYGKQSKGNYPKLSKLAQITPIFPDIDNARSMLHIDNLSEFIKIVIEHEDSGIFFPQNEHFVSTSQLVKTISKVHGKHIWITGSINVLIRPLLKIKLMNKVFGNLVYEKSLSKYDKADYQIRDFEETIKLTER